MGAGFEGVRKSFLAAKKIGESLPRKQQFPALGEGE
jgi:hypothetical protein